MPPIGICRSQRSHGHASSVGDGGGTVWHIEVARVLCLTAEPTPLALLGQVVIKADFKMTVSGLVTGGRGTLRSYHDLFNVLLDLEHCSNAWSTYCSPFCWGPSPCLQVLSKVTGPPEPPGCN